MHKLPADIVGVSREQGGFLEREGASAEFVVWKLKSVWDELCMSAQSVPLVGAGRTSTRPYEVYVGS